MPDAPPPPPPPHGAAPAPQTEGFPCRGCGAQLTYSPGEDALECPFCGEIHELAAASPWEKAKALKELDFEAALSGALSRAEHETARVVPCPSCGAENLFEGTQIARSCPWCATPLADAPASHDALRPRAALPFLLTEAEARDAMSRWLGGLWFAPSDLKRFARAGRTLDGLYAPCWTFDARTATRYLGRRGDRYYETRTVPVRTDKGMRMETRQVARIRWSKRAGSVRRDFDDVLRPATRAIPAEEFDGLGPWDLAALEPFDPRFLAGFRAETHSVPLEQGFAEARGIMDRIIEADIRAQIGGDRQMIDKKRTAVSDVTFKLALVPVWLAAYRYRGKAYRVAVNGRTGRVQGGRPWSAVKIALAVLAAAAVLGAGIFLARHGG